MIYLDKNALIPQAKLTQFNHHNSYSALLSHKYGCKV